MTTAPLVVLLYDRIYLAGSWGELWRRRAGPYAGLDRVLGRVCRIRFPCRLRSASDRLPAILGVPPLAYALAQPGVILHDLGLVFWPLGTSYRYFGWPLEQPAASYVLPLVVVGALLLTTVWALLRRPKIGFLGSWFFLTLAPTSSLIPLADAAGDYRMYLPLAAVAVLVGPGRLRAGRVGGERAVGGVCGRRPARCWP